MVQEVAEGGQPFVITQNGKARAVLMDVRAHERLLATLAMLKLLAQSQESLNRGRSFSTSEVRARAHAALARAKRNG